MVLGHHVGSRGHWCHHRMAEEAMSQEMNGIEFLLICVVPVAVVIGGYIALKMWARRK